MSVDETIALRRAACLFSNIVDASRRETAIRAVFADCLDEEAKEK
jgi:hypothetical protein